MLLVLAALMLAPTTQPASRDAPELRRSIAILRDAGDDPAELRRAATDAADVLGDGWRNAARLRNVADLPDDELADAVQGMADRLAFRPIMEADTPPDWPAPTVVGEVEVKRYPPHRLARAATDRGRPDSLFSRLFDHIQGNDIPMTTPVEMTGMQDDGPATMAFLYPDDQTGDLGQDGEVEVLDVPAATFMSVGLLGGSDSPLVPDAVELLRQRLADDADWRAAGEPRVLGYNSPAVPDRISYAEVQIPVQPAE